MNYFDCILNDLVSLRLKGEPLPLTVEVKGESVATTDFLGRFRYDYREAWPSIALYAQMRERPLVTEIAQSLT